MMHRSDPSRRGRSWAFFGSIALLVGMGCASSGDPTSQDSLPSFNAVDGTLACPAGQVGWNFATGGGAVDDGVGNGSAGVIVDAATYGRGLSLKATSCGWGCFSRYEPVDFHSTSFPLSDWTSAVAEKCNGKFVCELKVDPALKGDPAPGQKKAFAVRYHCGSDSTVYEQNIEAEAAGKTVTLSCGPKMHVVKATLGANCGVAEGTHTDAVRQVCEAQRVCDLRLEMKDPAVGCQKSFAVDYTCGTDPATHTVTVDKEALGKTARLECSPTPLVTIKSATFGARCGRGADITRSVASTCDGHVSCDFKPVDIDSWFANSGSCVGDTNITYTCGDSPRTYSFTTPALGCTKDARSNETCANLPARTTAALSCAGATATSANYAGGIGAKACIAKNCSWRQKRDGVMGCVDAPKPWVEFAYVRAVGASSPTSTAVNNMVDLTQLKPATAYQFGIAMNLYHAEAFHSKGVLWATDVFTDGATTAEGFVCTVATFDASSEAVRDKNVGFGTPLAELSADCTDPRTNSWADAARRQQITEAEFRRRFRRTKSKLHVSFDPDGDVGYPSMPGVYDVTKLKAGSVAPNPVGFFFDPTSNTIDQIAYLQQRELKFEGGRDFDVGFVPATDLNLGILPSSLVVEGSPTTLALYAVSDPPPITVRAAWRLTGHRPSQNPFSAGATPVAGITRLSERNPRIEFFIAPVYTGNRGYTGYYSTDYFDRMSLGPPVPLDTTRGSVVSTSATATYVLPQAVRDRMFGDWKIYDQFQIVGRIAIDGVSPGAPASTTVDGKTYTLGIEKDAAVTDFLFLRDGGNFLVKRDYLRRNLQAQQPLDYLGNAKANRQGDSQQQGGQDSAQEKRCTGTGVDANANLSCTARQTTGSQGSGGLGASTYYTTTMSMDYASTKSSLTATPDAEAEAMGIQVLDAEDDDDEQKPYTFAKQGDYPNGSKARITITPNWDLVVQTLNKEPEPEWKKGRYGGQMGLGAGIGYKTVLNVGPLPIIATITASVGVSLALVIDLKFQPESPYPCINQDGAKCARVLGASVSQGDAAKACAVKGGRLLEVVTPADATAAAQIAGQGRVWVGGQSAYDWQSAPPTCFRRQSDPDCKNASKTSWRWIGSDTELATSTGTSNSVLYPAPTKTGAPLTITPIVPASAGLVYENGRLYSAPQGESHDAICEFEGATKATYSGFAFGLALGAGAGIGLSACTPSEDIGLCLEAGINIVDLGITPTISHDAFDLYGTQLVTVPGFGVGRKRIGRRGNTNVSVPWGLSLFTGDIRATLNLYFWSTSWTIASYDGFRVAGGNLYSYDWPTREVIP